MRRKDGNLHRLQGPPCFPHHPRISSTRCIERKKEKKKNPTHKKDHRIESEENSKFYPRTDHRENEMVDELSQSWVLDILTCLCVLSHSPSRIDLIFFSPFTEGARTHDWSYPKKKKKTISIIRNRLPSSQYRQNFHQDVYWHLPRRMEASRISKYSLQKHAQHRSASMNQKPAR